MSSALSQSTDVEQFSLPIDVPVPQTQFSASLGLGLMHTSPQMVPGVTLTVRVLHSMQHPDIAAQLKWLQVDEAAAVYFLSPNLALCTHTRCLIINAADLASSGLSLSPAHSPRSNGPTPSEFALGSTGSTFSLAAAVSAAAAAAAAASERGGLPTAESVGGGTLHPALVQLFTNDRIIKMGIDVTALLVDLFNSSDHVRGASFIELQNISSLTSSAALLSSDAPSLAADPLDTILQLLTSEITLDHYGSTNLHHAIASRVFKLFCLGLRINQSTPLLSVQNLTPNQLASMLESPDTFAWPPPMDESGCIDSLMLARSRQRIRLALAHVLLPLTTAAGAAAANLASALAPSSAYLYSSFVVSGGDPIVKMGIGSGSNSVIGSGARSPFKTNSSSPALRPARPAVEPLMLPGMSSLSLLQPSAAAASAVGGISELNSSSSTVLPSGFHGPSFGAISRSIGSTSGAQTPFQNHATSNATSTSTWFGNFSGTATPTRPEGLNMSIPTLPRMPSTESSAWSLDRPMSLEKIDSAAVWDSNINTAMRPTASNTQNQNSNYFGSSNASNAGSNSTLQSMLRQFNVVASRTQALEAADPQLARALAQARQTVASLQSGAEADSSAALGILANALHMISKAMRASPMMTPTNTTPPTNEPNERIDTGPSLLQPMTTTPAPLPATQPAPARPAPHVKPQSQQRGPTVPLPTVSTKPRPQAATAAGSTQSRAGAHVPAPTIAKATPSGPVSRISAAHIPAPVVALKPKAAPTVAASASAGSDDAGSSLSTSTPPVVEKAAISAPQPPPTVDTIAAPAANNTAAAVPRQSPTSRAAKSAPSADPVSDPAVPVAPAAPAAPAATETKQISYASLAAVAATPRPPVRSPAIAAQSSNSPTAPAAGAKATTKSTEKASSSASSQQRHRDPTRSTDLDRVLYKTAMCKRFMESGHCAYGSECGFAHGEHELRKLSPGERTSLAQLTRQSKGKENEDESDESDSDDGSNGAPNTSGTAGSGKRRGGRRRGGQKSATAASSTKL